MLMICTLAVYVLLSGPVLSEGLCVAQANLLTLHRMREQRGTAGAVQCGHQGKALVEGPSGLPCLC